MGEDIAVIVILSLNGVNGKVDFGEKFLTFKETKIDVWKCYKEKPPYWI